MADASTSGLIVRLQHSPNHFRQRRVLGDRVDGDPPRDRPRPGPRENPDRQQLIVVKGLDVVAQHRNSSSQAVTKLLSRNVDARVDNRLVQCGCLRPFVTRRRRLRSLVSQPGTYPLCDGLCPTRHAQRVRRAPSTRRRQRRRTHRPRRRRRVTLRVSNTPSPARSPVLRVTRSAPQCLRTISGEERSGTISTRWPRLQL